MPRLSLKRLRLFVPMIFAFWCALPSYFQWENRLRIGDAPAQAAASKLAITSINGGGNPTAGTGFPVVAQSQDASGSPTNVIGATFVSLSLKTGTGTLGGTLTGTIAAGTNQVTITGVTYTKAESGVVITATSTVVGLTTGDSAPFTVVPGAAAKVFATQPGNSTAGSPLSGPPTVVVQDSLGNTVTTSTASITIAIGTNPGGGTLSGTTPKSATGGVATFSDLSIDKAGTGYTLTASSTGLTSATSSAFNITVAAASKLVFTTQPLSAMAGSALGGPPTVKVQDSFGNTVTSSTASIAIAIGTNPGGGTLSGTTLINAVSGSASFSDLSIDKAGTGYTLTASAAGLTSATSSAFNITAAAATKLVFSVQPPNSTAGAAISGAAWPTVIVQDSFGNTVTSSTASIAITIGTNPGGGTLSGTTPKNASGGVATFSDLSIDKAGNGYTLTATATGLTSATSNAFNITAGAASQVAFTTQPGSTTAGTAIPGPTTATVRDSFGNTVTSSTASITVAIGNNPGGGTLSGTTTKNASVGVASFADLSIDKAGTGYTLTASAAGLTGATSSAFNISTGAASQVAFTTQPVNCARRSSDSHSAGQFR